MTAGRHNNNRNKEWSTPRKYVDAVTDFFGKIELDPCSNEYSIVHAKTEFRLPTDGLNQDWTPYKTIFVNPPYGKDKERGTSIYDWIRKCWETCNRSYAEIEILALIPVATNTKHWKKYIFGIASGICFLADTRLKFLISGEEQKKGAPMACAMVYWGRNLEKFETVFSNHGAIVQC